MLFCFADAYLYTAMHISECVREATIERGLECIILDTELGAIVLEECDELRRELVICKCL